MTTSTRQLLDISSMAIGATWLEHEDRVLEPFGKLGRELRDLLRSRNGFFAFESALHIFPLGSTDSVLNMGDWNDPRSWKAEYGDLLLSPLLCFAQDAFGNQFSLADAGVGILFSEFADFELLATTIEEWITLILSEWREQTGFDLAHSWQTAFRPLVEGERLIPKIPFVVGGEHEITNLYAGRALDAMRFRGSLARQINAIADETPIQLEVKDEGRG